MPKLTKRIVDAARPNGRDYFLWDGELPGFGLRVFASGKRSYLVQYRANGRLRRVTIGQHGAPWTPDDARKRALRLLTDIKHGGDPADARDKARRTPMISAVADRYLAEHVETHNKLTTAREFRRIVEQRIRPAFGKRKIDALSRSEIRDWHHSMRSKPYEANRALAVLSKMLSLAAHDWELRRDNPCKGIKRHAEKKRERFFSDSELRRIGEALRAAEEEGSASRQAVLAICLLALTGCRLSEILSLRWSYVDLEQGALRLPDAKAGARAVPLGAPAAALLMGEQPHSDWVIPAPAGDKHLPVSSLEKAWRRIKTAAGLDDARLHDFRHTKGTFAAQAGLNAFMVRDILGHKTLAMTARYVERDTNPLRAADTAVSNRIAAAMGTGSPANVVGLKAR